ncbi:sushi, von Willebrand factor type A, EGF and pentraxin domain-containing protein 1 [Siphateles boraxobius]|uniref:sushi, von Willebrand factor type A, EGF and pentraxin domain-containing protein 1 n=1 Tax=Siphateles boraxobius TaxID=180520 RepID=UPI004062BF91
MATVWGIILILVFAHFVVSISRFQTHNKCGEPTKYQDKQLDNKYLDKVVFNDQEKVAYKCVRGYSQSEGSRLSYCKKGQWTTLNMKCQKRKCNALGDIENGQYMRDGQSFGDRAIATCNTGYVLRGARVRMCLEKGWNGTDPICEVVATPLPGLVSKIICSAPVVANRWMYPGERTQYTPQDTETISCSEGFDLIGSSAVTCGPDGQWLNLPECRPKGQFSKVLFSRGVDLITCPTPELGKSGSVKEPKSAYKPGESVSVTCNEGFNGSGDFTCHTSAIWLPHEPKCQMINCSAPTVANGRIHGSSVVYKPKSMVDVICNEGFDLIGPPQVTCGPDGQWQGLPECRPKRISASGKCGPAPSHPNLELRDGSSTLKEYPSGVRIRYRCGLGYRRARGSDSIHCQAGRWTNPWIQCERKKCGSAGEIPYGHFEYTGVSFGDSAKAICQEGYELIGPQMRTCRDGGWDGRAPVCEPVHCPPPPEVQGAEISDPIYDHVPFGRVVSYRCRSGALIGAREIHCTQKGTWSAPPPECKDIVCPQPHVPRGSRMRGFRSVYKFGNTVTIVCNPGSRLIGESFVTCGLDGKWKPRLPECGRWNRY